MVGIGFWSWWRCCWLLLMISDDFSDGGGCEHYGADGALAL